jgi:hypothetical protein
MVEAIQTVISNADAEIVMVVPYLKVSPFIFDSMVEANRLGKEILVIYREDSLNDYEKKKLLSLHNLTLMHHSDVHAKCYFNEKETVIGSMNLYEYSEKFNREMGVLISNEYQSQFYSDMLDEVRSLLKAATIERLSRKKVATGFKYNLLTLDDEKLKPYINLINDLFINKEFELERLGRWTTIKCYPYLEDIQVEIDYKYENEKYQFNRFVITFLMDENIIEFIHSRFIQNYRTPDFFRLFWDHYKARPTIYPPTNKREFLSELDFVSQVKDQKPNLDFFMKSLNEIIKDAKRKV